MSKFEKLRVGNMGLIRETEDGRIIQIGLTEINSEALQVFLAALSQETPLVQMGKDYELVLKSDSMSQCTEEFDEDICPGCTFFRSESVSHPAGGSVHSVDKNRCEAGFWEDNF